jgi:hypothetical protein
MGEELKGVKKWKSVSKISITQTGIRTAEETTSLLPREVFITTAKKESDYLPSFSSIYLFGARIKKLVHASNGYSEISFDSPYPDLSFGTEFWCVM